MSLLADLSGNPEWQAIISAARKMRPDLPRWSQENPTPESEWIHKSGMQDGFDLCLQIFAPLK
jgi:hypothetical protein